MNCRCRYRFSRAHDEMIAFEYVDHTKEYAKEGAIDASQMLLKAFPDFHVTIEDI